MDQELRRADLHQLRDDLVRAKLTVSCAESVTVGHVQSLLGQVSNASQYFVGGLTTYNVRQKVTHLQVDASDAAADNGVSARVAEEMACGACRLFRSDLGLGVTGYAEPYPQQKIDEPLAYIALAYRGQVVRSERVAGSRRSVQPSDADARVANQEAFAVAAVTILREFVRDVAR